jgi:hypothetical protein
MGRPRIIEVALPSNLKGITLFPFIFVENKRDRVLINHEKIHYQQAKELFVIGFYLWYLWEWIRRGYKKNRFEVEAYANEKDLNYLKTRKPYNYFTPNRYIKK